MLPVQLPPRSRVLALGGALLVGLALAGLAIAWASAARHVQRLEGELRQLYGREAALHARLAEQEREIRALSAERDRLASRAARPPARAPVRRPPGGRTPRA